MSDTLTPTPPTIPTRNAPALGRDGKPLPENTQTTLDLNHRVMVEEYLDWYYPNAKPSMDAVVAEMVGIAWAVAKNDPNRPETRDERIGRLGGVK